MEVHVDPKGDTPFVKYHCHNIACLRKMLEVLLCILSSFLLHPMLEGNLILSFWLNSLNTHVDVHGFSGQKLDSKDVLAS